MRPGCCPLPTRPLNNMCCPCHTTTTADVLCMWPSSGYYYFAEQSVGGVHKRLLICCCDGEVNKAKKKLNNSRMKWIYNVGFSTEFAVSSRLDMHCCCGCCSCCKKRLRLYLQRGKQQSAEVFFMISNLRIFLFPVRQRVHYIRQMLFGCCCLL